MRRPPAHWLFVIILVEGYAVLASELLAIRLLIPFVGSGTETIAIIISAVLLPLAVGYQAGGQFRSGVRERLVYNILTALAFLGLGLSYTVLEWFFAILTIIGVTDHLVQAALYSLLFLVVPVFLLGQTVPLISNYFGRARLSTITGRMLFFSTAGSFLGSVFSTLVLMNTIGVRATVIVTLALLAAMLPFLTASRDRKPLAIGLAILAFVVFANSGSTRGGIVSDNAYNTASVHESSEDGSRILALNRSSSSGLTKDGGLLFDYTKYIDTHFLKPLALDPGDPYDILVIGAGGFTLGLDDARSRYTYVDIDPALKKVSEKHFLKRTLGPNKRFVPASARAFLTRETALYDLIVIDTFTNMYSVPMETTTREFLLAAKARLNQHGILIVNMIAAPDFADAFSIRYDATFASVFPRYTRQVIGDFDPWSVGKPPDNQRNVLYIYYHRPGIDDATTYTDDRNTYSMDR